MSEELAVYQTQAPALTAGQLDIAQIEEQVQAIQQLLVRVMKPETHYGVIPGTSGKPSLFKPGAEKICFMFRLAPSYETERMTLPNGHREYEVTCTLTHIPTATTIGQASGSASTMESKHRYRGAAGRQCPSCGAIACRPAKRESGGGFYCDRNGGGCGAQFKATSPEATAIQNSPAVRMENTDPADQYNTVLKMAQKRALVAAVLIATAASDIFAQDLEDIEGTDTQVTEPPIKQTTRKAPPAAKAKPTAAPEKPAATKAESRTVTVTLDRVDVTEGTAKNGKAYTRYTCTADGQIYTTFDKTVGEGATALEGSPVTIKWRPEGDKGQFRRLESINPAAGEASEAATAGDVDAENEELPF